MNVFTPIPLFYTHSFWEVLELLFVLLTISTLDSEGKCVQLKQQKEGHHKAVYSEGGH